MITNPFPLVERFEEEETYTDPRSKRKERFPNIHDSYSVHLSVVVPAYNEEERCEFYIPFVRFNILNSISKVIFKTSQVNIPTSFYNFIWS